MMKNNSLIAKYNQPDTLLVIASYPSRGGIYSSRTGGGLASFTKNTVLALNNKAVVLCDRQSKEEAYEEGSALILRTFTRNSLSLYTQLIRTLLHFNKVKNVLVEFEFACYGDFIITSLFPLFLAIARLLGKNITLVLHQVTLDLTVLSGHLGFKSKSLKLATFNFLLTLYYRLLASVAQKVIVLEAEHKKRLSQLVSGEKIVTISHGVDNQIKSISHAAARKRLGIPQKDVILLYFGFLTWYKGVDFLVKTFTSKPTMIGKRRVRLILAGGESPTQKDKLYYRSFVKKLYKQAANNQNIMLTGFVPEKMIPAYFAACDIVVLPYRAFMSSSGPLSLALSYRKPFMLSKTLANYFESPEFQRASRITGITKKQITFTLNKKSFFETLNKLLAEKLITQFSTFSDLVASERSFEVLAPAYTEVIESTTSRTKLPTVRPLAWATKWAATLLLLDHK